MKINNGSPVDFLTKANNSFVAGDNSSIYRKWKIERLEYKSVIVCRAEIFPVP